MNKAILIGLLLLPLASDSQIMAQSVKQPTYALAIHGGAGGDPSAWSPEYQQQRLDGLRRALDLGIEMLDGEAHAIDVVEAVVRSMEDDESFNAGRGCVLNEDGEHELDAAIMDGRDLQCGAVAGVIRTKHPITLARKVMSETMHVLMIGNGADDFGRSLGIEQADAAYFRTERQKAAWKLWRQHERDVSLHLPEFLKQQIEQLYLGTVGCVVCDSRGDLAAATSTGGLKGKRKGRVGDSAIIGAGNYADNATCAVSGTGIGEEFIRHMVAGDIAARVRYRQQPLADAAREVVKKLPAECGGVIAVDAAGHVVMEFNTPGMSRAWATSSGERQVALGRDE